VGGREGGEGGQVPVGREKEDVGAGGVHLVGLAGVDGLLLNIFDLEGVQLLVKHLKEGGREGGREGGESEGFNKRLTGRKTKVSE